MVIGVTGKYCSGKDTAIRILKDSGFTEINVDKIGHDILDEKKHEVVEEFGNSILSDNNSINRRKLGKIVFPNKKAMKKLEAIIHPAMVSRVKKKIKEINSNTVINAAILFKMGLDRLCNAVFCIKTPFFKRFSRALQRDSLTVGETLQRLLSQNKLCPKSKHRDVDIYYIRNHKSNMYLKKQLICNLDKISL